METGAPYELEHRLRRADGVYRWFQARGHALRGVDGCIVRWSILFTDIDARRKAEEKLRSSEAFLLEAQSMSHTGSWQFDLATRKLTLSPEVFRIRGIPPSSELQPADFFFEDMHPDNRPRVGEACQAALTHHRDFAADYRVLRPDGTVGYMHNVGHPVRNSAGEVLEYSGTCSEVTELVEARLKLETALEEIRRLKDRLQDENQALREEVVQASMFEEIVGSSPALQTTLTSITMVAPTDSTVLILGETGTGKELVARAIHAASPPRDQPVRRGQLRRHPARAWRVELFGHEKGAFTGAVGSSGKGRFELADGGTIFLDEIGEIPLADAGQAAARPAGARVRARRRRRRPSRSTCA